MPFVNLDSPVRRSEWRGVWRALKPVQVLRRSTKTVTKDSIHLDSMPLKSLGNRLPESPPACSESISYNGLVGIHPLGSAVLTHEMS